MEKCKSIDQEWFQAVERGNLHGVQRLLKEIGDIDYRGSYLLNNVKHNGVTGLIVASHHGNKELVRWFLANKADANASTHLGWRSIHFAAKRGHVATIDMLCSSGAAVDPVTLDDDTPLSLALQSHMRDSARKLVNLGAQVSRFNEGMLCRYIHRGVLPAEVLSRARAAPDSPHARSKLSSQVESAHNTVDPSNDSATLDESHCTDNQKFVLGVHDSRIIINQLQSQSTSYDLELARRKRELIRRLPAIGSLPQQAANVLVQQTHRLIRADLPTFERLHAVQKIFSVLSSKSLSSAGDENVHFSLGAAVEPYLRLFEACMCESHCPSILAEELSVISACLVILGGGRNGELNGSTMTEDITDTGALRGSFIASYVTRLLRKLISKNNPQYRAGVLSHLCRLLSPPGEKREYPNYQKGVNFWSDPTHYTAVLSGLVRLGETLDQPINVARLSALIGLVGRRLSEVSSPAAVSASSSRFSDLADILVGWGVDHNSVTRGINLQSIYTELCFGLAGWWLHSPHAETNSEGSTVEKIPSLNPSMHEMMCHLLEDSEKSMSTAMEECQVLSSVYSKPPSDATPHLISVDLYLSILSSIIEGVHNQMTSSSQHRLCNTLGLSNEEGMEWFDRLLQLAKSAYTRYCFSWFLCDGHGPVGILPRVSFSLVDKIECTVLRLLNCFSHESLPQSAYVYLTKNLLVSKQPPISSECLEICLELLRKFILSLEPNARTAVLHTCYGARSALHTYKFSFAAGNPHQPKSKLLLKALCQLSENDDMRDALHQLASLDLKLAVRFIKIVEKHKGPSADDFANCEGLALFSLALFSVLLKNTAHPAARSQLRRHLLDIFAQEYALWWFDVPSRIRIALIVFFNEEAFLTSLQPVELVHLVSVITQLRPNLAFELSQICLITQAILNSAVLTSSSRCEILVHLCKLARRMLRTAQPLHTCSRDPFVTCVRVLIAHAFVGRLEESATLRKWLLRLSEDALYSNLPERQEVCSDLLLAMSVSKINQSHTTSSHLGLAWYTTRRPDRSATALVTPPGSSKLTSNTLVGSGSAYPSLPAVAGVLGFLTRGAPYNAAKNSSRLQILKEPSDWIRRLFYLICPIPAELSKSQFSVNAEDAVLWYAAWTMIDYKLKVAPWVNPLKTFLSLEGTMHAILRPYIAPEAKKANISNSMSVASFHTASTVALTRQPWFKQIRQAQSLFTFLGFLDRLIENASKGFAVSLPRPLPPACVFFAANEATCSQWFGRIRGLLLRIADDWPLPPVENGCAAGDVPASVLYHAYSPLSIVMKSDSSDTRSWLSGVTHHGISCDMLVRVAKALYRLSAWEELEALSGWVVQSFGKADENPFAWIHGLSLLSRGQWDNALETFRTFVDRYVQEHQASGGNNSTEDVWTLGFAYVTDLLLQCYLDAGDTKAALALRDLVQSTLKLHEETGESVSTTADISSLKLSCMRLSYVEKLTNWSSSTTTTRKNKQLEDEEMKTWSHQTLTTNLCRRLVDAVVAVKTNTSNTQVCTVETCENLSALVSNVRLASSAAYSSSSRRLACPYDVQWGLTGESTMRSWLVRADLLLNPSEQGLTESDLVTCRTNTIAESSWRHLLQQPEGFSARLNSGLQSCRWACDTENFKIAKQLLIRELKALSLLPEKSASSIDGNIEALYRVLRSSDFTQSDKLSHVQRLLFGDCLAQLLWSANTTTTSFNAKLSAIDTLSHGLRTAILDKANTDPKHHAARCQVSTKVALRLFDWLEAPCPNLARGTWAEWISQGRSDSGDELCSTAKSVVSNLSLFSQLVDEPWVNGLPVVSSVGDHSPNSLSSNRSSSQFIKSTHSVWLSRLLMMTTRLAPTGSSPAAWLRMASWCYSQGQTMVERVRVMTKEMMNEPSKWVDPKAALESTMCSVLQLDDYHQVAAVLKQYGFHSPSDSVDDGETKVDPCVPMLIAALLTFLTSDQLTSASGALATDDEPTAGSSSSLRPTKLCPDDETNEMICELLRLHLHKTLPQLFSPSTPLPDEMLKSLHRLVIGLTQRQYTLHTSAAQAYATYLTVAGQCAAPGEPISRLDTTAGKSTLKLLDLLSCPSRALRNLIAGFLMHGGPAPRSNDNENVRGPGTTLGGPAIWEACLPQVLVRLSLPDPTIRSCLVALLTRLILTGPESAGSVQSSGSASRWRCSSLRFAAHLVFPSVIAAMDSAEKPVSAKKITVQGSDAYHQDVSGRSAGSCFVQIVSALQNSGFSALVNQVETFVLELQRLTLLWEELWLGCLLQHSDELAKKVTLLETETKRSIHWRNYDNQSVTDNNLADKENRASDGSTPSSDQMETKKIDIANSGSLKDVMRIKFIAVAQPTLDLISRLSSLTIDVQPETPHEEWFQKTFGPSIRQLRENLTHPTENADGKYLLHSVRQLVHQLQMVHQSSINAPSNRGLFADGEPRVLLHAARPSLGCVFHLSLSHLSPRLTKMLFGDRGESGIGIPLPGRPELESAHLVNRIAILPTKTKPKRLLFRAQNGQTYPYLLKGLEDLRLDDRIMRLFELINVALAQPKSVDLVQLNQMCARTYAITPLGVRAGLLQMVQGAVPLFSLYKRWQIRSAKPPSIAGDADSRAVIVPRPGELFHTRLKEFLLASGLPYQPQARNNWPIETLREVFLSLESETPSDLLSRELWAANPSAASWWSTTRTFCRSVGVMSILGYLVGLGDRHLDNLLADLTTGHLIHIDYNVCFDKGRTLRVAERVPFRLTHILRHTLGPLAQDRLVRGTFRVAAEQTLTTARSVIDSFLIQMKAFLIDPLVDWQDKKQSNSQSGITVTDFTHLGAYYGGGSSATRHHYWASCLRKQSRVSAEARTYAGLLATRLHDLLQSSSLLDVCSALTTARSYFQVWVTWCETSRELTEAERNQKMLTNSVATSIVASEARCRKFEEAAASVVSLRTLLCDHLTTWQTETTPLCQIFSHLSDPLWLPSLKSMHEKASPELNSALTEYYLLARVYLTHPGLFMDDYQRWTQEFFALQSALEQFIEGSMPLDACLDRFSKLNYARMSRTPDKQIIALLEQGIHRSRCAVSELQDSLQKSQIPEGNTISVAIRPDSDNLHLFVFDQGVFGVSAFIWSLIDYLPGAAANMMSLEADCDGDAGGRIDGDLLQSESSSLNQLTFSADYLGALFGVLHHHFTGTFQFTAGFEADVQRDIAFMYAVRDATMCISQLRTNLVRLLLLPETESALIDTASPSPTEEECDDLIEQFTGLMAQYVTESDPVSLKERVNQFLLTSRSSLAARDVRLHQVLLAVHLALTNTTTQMEEIAVRIRELGFTPPTWFYVDIIAQAASNLLARCRNWRSGASSLWGWEQSFGTESIRSDHESSFRCSWVDEVYAMGLMAFVSILEEGRAHWNAIRGTSVTPTQDIVLNPCSEPIDRFISRLVSRTGLASLLAFASGRLFCSLVEDTGVSIRRLLMESEHNAKFVGIPNVVVQLSAEKLAETVGLHLSTVQPGAVHHLRASAASLVHRLVIHANQVNEHLVAATRLEVTQRHLDHLQQSLAVLKWISPVSAVGEQPQLEEPSQTNCSTLLHVLSTLKQATANAGESVSISNSDPTLCDVAKAVCFCEEIRIFGVESYSGHEESLRLLKELKVALLEEEKCSAQLLDLDKTLLAIKSKYNLKWPASGWLDQRCLANVDGPNKTSRTLRAQLQADVRTAKTQFSQASMEVMRIRSELLTSSNVKTETEGDNTVQSNTTMMSRYTNKRASGKHTRANLSSPPGLAISSNTNDPAPAGPPKMPHLVTRLRMALTNLQSQRLSELRQLVKLLSRYENARAQLAVDDAPCLTHVWSSWLEKHQSWTSLVLATLKQLSKFISQLSGVGQVDQRDVSSTQADFCGNASEEMENLNSEAQIAARLLQDCWSIHSNLWSSLLEPLFEAVEITVEPDESLSKLVSQLLAPVRLQIENLILGDHNLNETPANPLAEAGSTEVHTSEPTGCVSSEFEEVVNPQALEVWCRTRDRLAGRDPLLEPYHVSSKCRITEKDAAGSVANDRVGLLPMPVDEQVDSCIRAATDVDNLALMYEGWTSWV